MSEQLRDQVSAFIDGELPVPESEMLLKRLQVTREIRATAERYIAIGECLRTSSASVVSRSFAQRVSTLVASEAALPAAPANRVALHPARWLKPLAGLAVAATIAGIAILGLQSMQPETAAPLVAGNTPVETIGEPSSNESISYTVPEPPASGPLLIPAARLTNYAVAHSEYASPLWRRNVLSGIIAEDPTPVDEQPAPDAKETADPDAPPAAH